MERKSKTITFMSLSIFAAFLLICSPVSLRCEKSGKGNIIGFVFDKDGTTPLDGVSVKFLNVTTDAVYESTRTDINGLFKVVGIDNGLYIFGVLTPQGDFMLDDLIGVKIQENETAKLSISLMPKEDIVQPKQKIATSKGKNTVPEPQRIMSKNEFNLPEQDELLIEEELALAEFRGIASVNSASSGISFGILTSNPDGTAKVACSPHNNFSNIVTIIRNWWRQWWNRCSSRS